jgi:predicted dehydrogenase
VEFKGAVDKMINWGIIGCGNVTEVKSGPAFNKVKNSRLIAVMRRDAALAEDYAVRHNVPKFYTNADDLINDKEINAIYIATPPVNHAEYAIKSIKTGKPVYIEKPMALNFNECRKIINAGEKYKVPVFVAYYRRALPGFVMVKEIVEKGLIGIPEFVNLQLFKSASAEELTGNTTWRVNPEISGGGHFFDLASHQLDYLDFLFGPIETVKSIALNQAGLYKAEDYVSMEFLFRNKIAGTGTWSFAASPSSSRDIIEIIGNRGHIKFSCFNFEPIVLENQEGRKEFINERPENVQIYLIEQVVKALNHDGTAVSTGITAARTSRVMDEAVKEYYKNLK